MLTALQRHILATILWSPVTWVPLTAATFGATILDFPWWANLLSFAAAGVTCTAFWAAQMPRLSQLWNVENTQRQQEAALAAEKSLVEECSRKRFTQGASVLTRGYAVRDAIRELYREHPQLHPFHFMPDALALLGDIERLVRAELARLTPGSCNTAQHLRQLDDLATTLDDTLATCKSTLENLDSPNLATTTATAAATAVRERNRATREALEAMDETN